MLCLLTQPLHNMVEHAEFSYSEVEEVTRLKRTSKTKAAGRDVVDLEMEKKKKKGRRKGRELGLKKVFVLFTALLLPLWSLE